MPPVTISFGTDRLWTEYPGQGTDHDARGGMAVMPDGSVVKQVGGQALNAKVQAFTVDPDANAVFGNPVELYPGAFAVAEGSLAAIDNSRVLAFFTADFSGTLRLMPYVAMVTKSGMNLTVGTPVPLGLSTTATGSGQFAFSDTKSAVTIVDAANAIVVTNFQYADLLAKTTASRVLISGSTLTAGNSTALDTANNFDPSPHTVRLQIGGGVAVFWQIGSLYTYQPVLLVGTTGIAWSGPLRQTFATSGHLKPVQWADGIFYQIRTSSTPDSIRVGQVDPNTLFLTFSAYVPLDATLSAAGFFNGDEYSSTTLNNASLLLGYSNSATDQVGFQLIQRSGPDGDQLGIRATGTVAFVQTAPYTDGASPSTSSFWTSRLNATTAFFEYQYADTADDQFKNHRAFTIKLPFVPPLRWRQRDDCLEPGTARPCICFNLTPGITACIPPFWLRLTTSVQFGGRVGPRNTYS